MRVWLTTVWLVGCGAAALTNEPVRPAPRTELPAGEPSPIEPSPIEPSWQYVPRASAAGIPVAIADGDTMIVAQSRYRARAAEGRIEWATQLAPDVLVGLTHREGRWLFVTGAGELFAADEPLGDLTPSGAMGAPWAKSAWPLLLDVRGRLFRVGTDGLVRVATDVPVVDVAFVDESFGARLDATGLVHFTTDGGETWRAVLLDETPIEVSAGTDAIVVGTRARPRTLARDGGIGVGGSAGRALPIPPLAPPEIATGPTEDGHFGALDGRTAWVLPENVELGPATDVDVWGRFVVTRTTAGWVRSDGGPPARFAEGFERRALTFDETGTRFASRGACPTERERADLVCLTNLAMASARSFAIPGVDELRRWVGQRLFAETSESLVALDVTTGNLRASEPSLIHASVATDGTCAGRDLDGHFWLGPFDALQRLDVPEGTTEVAPADAQHVVATGRGRWFSEDGGVSWTAGPEGAPRRGARCTVHGCSVGDGVWGPSARIAHAAQPSASGTTSSPRDAAPPVSPLAALVGLAGVASREPVLDDDFDVTVECETPGAWAGHPLERPLPRSDPRLAVGHGWVHLAAGASFGSGRLRGELAPIGGRPVRFVAGDVPGPPGAPEPSEEPRDQPHLTVVASTDTSAIVLREWVVATGRSVLDLVRVSSAAAPQVVAVLPTNGSVGGALTQPDGSVVVWLPEGPDDALVVIDPHGAVENHRFPVGTLGRDRYLARASDGAVGLYRIGGDEAWWLGLDGSARGPWTPLDVHAVPHPCATSATAAIELVPRANQAQVWMPASSWIDRAHLTLAVDTDGSSCLAQAWLETDDWRGARGAFVAEPIDGVLQATLHGPTHDARRFGCIVRGEAERLHEAEGVLVAPLGSGAGALVADAEGHVRLGTLDATWSFAPSTLRWSPTRRVALLDGAAVTTAIAFDAPVELATPRETETLGVSEIGRASDGLVITSSHLAEENVSLVVARRGTTAGPTLRVEGLAVGALLAVRGGGARGLLLLCQASEDGTPRGPCEARGMEVASGVVSTHARIPLEMGLPILADPSRGLAVLAEEEHEEQVVLQLRGLEGRAASPIGPPIVRTAYAEVRGPIGLAATLDPPRIAYLDGTGTSDDHVRVVELRGRGWWDVAPPLHVHAATGAVFVGDELIVVDAAEERIASHRLRDGSWSTIDVAP